VVGIVVVSHSRALARAAVALAEEMLPDRAVPIVIAAGLDEEIFGTDATQIEAAIVEADHGDGVVVLMDLGSAILSAELAVEMLADDDLRQRVLLCPAPLIEGLVVAVVTARSGAGREQVATEASAALDAKRSQLAPADAAPSPAAPAQAAPALPGSEPGIGRDVAPEPASGRLTLTPEHGLHARPAARLVQLLQGLDATVELRNLSTDSGWVPGASLSRLTMLGALRGHELQVRASGRQADEAVAQVLALAGRNFDDPRPSRDQPGPATGRPGGPGPGPGPAVTGRNTQTGANPQTGPNSSTGPTTATGSTGSTDGTPVGVEAGAESEPKGGPDGGSAFVAVEGPFPASPGIGLGPARQAVTTVFPDLSAVIEPAAAPEDPQAENERLGAAIDLVRAQVQDIRAQVAREISSAEAAIFDAHLALLADPELLAAARTRIAAGEPASSAWANAVSVTAAGYESLSDPYLQARSADVRALGNQVSRHLLGAGDAPDRPERVGVLVAADLTPTEAATLDPERVIAVVLAYGSPTAHSAILIRARGIPAVVGAGPSALLIADGTLLAVDGTTGELLVDPPGPAVAGLRERAGAAQIRARAALARADTRATTRDGVEVLVGANLGSIEDARTAAECGADLAGLVRTEFLFLGRSQPPDVDEQEAAYLGLAEALSGRRITLRTLDVGGDKPLTYLPQALEQNPFLGVRGLRLSLRRPEVLADQLLAIVKVAHVVPVSVMFPMVSTLDELLRARRILDEAIKLVGKGEPAAFQVGIMVEVPAAALKAATFAAHVDFFSLGTNDLTQYTLAVERGNDAVTALADPLDPGVLRLIDATCRGAGGQASVAVCGELAADERATALLVGLGIRELSVTPRAVPGIKEAIRALTLPETGALAARALDASSADAVRTLLAPT
jgi:phosphoenolpyruvate-protein phosphotransferase/dihydroxyacetone kinase phosphotransfer subunit